MSLLHALVLGIVEGITEFLPVSSTAHLILTSHLLRIAESEFVKSFEIIIQLGAILSVVVLYWSRFWNWDVLKKLVVAVIPTGVIGLTVYKAIKGYLLGNIPVVLAALFVGGIALIIFERFQKGPQGGSGLGLAIAKSVVERHGGSLRVSSTPAGSRFTIRLPNP